MHITRTYGRLALTSMIALLLTACGGGGGGGGGNNDTTAPSGAINDSNIRTAAMHGYAAYYQVDELRGNPLPLEVGDFANFGQDFSSILSNAFGNWGDSSIEKSNAACGQSGTYSVDFSDDAASLTVSADDCKGSGGNLTNGSVTITKTPATSTSPDTYRANFHFDTTTVTPSTHQRSTTSNGLFTWAHISSSSESSYRFDVDELHVTISFPDGSHSLLEMKNFTSSFSSQPISASDLRLAYHFNGDLRIQDPAIPEASNNKYFHVETMPDLVINDTSDNISFFDSGEVHITGSDNNPLIIEFKQDGMGANLYLNGRLEATFGLMYAIPMWAHTPPGED